MYFKQYNDIDEDKQQYKRLFQLGVNDREIKKTISLKLAVVYFLPILGSVMGLLDMYYLSSIFGGGDIVADFMQKGVLGLVFYAVSQMLFYLILRHRYVKEVIFCQ